MKENNYIAGVLDSGCFMSIEKRRNQYRPVITITRESKEVLDFIRSLFGGSCRPIKSSYRLNLTHQHVYKLLREVGPLMLTKSREIQIIWQFHNYCGKIGFQAAREVLWKSIRQ